MEKDDQLDLIIYLALVSLTIISVVSAKFNSARSMAIIMALALASMKASLIGLYYMHLRHEKPVIHAILLTGIIAALILAIGILPDAALKL